MSKAIYMPKGKAAEYAKYACNFYVGCSNDCDYCYCKRGLLGHAMGKPTPTLKKSFDGHSPYYVFICELHDHIVQLRKHGLFFSFTTDPLLPETQDLTNAAVLYAVNQGVPCKILTKRADFKVLDSFEPFKHLIAYGFTLTGMDSMELHASTNMERISTMRYLHDRGFKTFASIEPVIDLGKSYDMINLTLDCCELYKIGLLTGKRPYTREQVERWMVDVDALIARRNAVVPIGDYNKPKVYWKDSVLEYIGMKRDSLDCLFHVGADYNMFDN